MPQFRRPGNGDHLVVHGAREHNLKDVTVEFPLGQLVAVTGVSGSGKSTLVNDILLRSLAKQVHRAKSLPGLHRTITGVEHIDKVVDVDQAPIGRTPRSNPATYTGVFDHIRKLFSQTNEAKVRGYLPGRFSFNVKGGRCESCSGDGTLRIEMHFLPDIYVPCEVCHGARYNRDTLEVTFRGKTIADVLDLSCEEALGFFAAQPPIARHLQTLVDVGLGYIRLGQSAPTLSGGEAQRVKLASELSRRSTGTTLYVLDEPTTGLHFDDVRKLLDVLNRLVDQGNTVIVIEHNLDVVKSADWIIDMGPEGGDRGGTVVAEGSPEQVAAVGASYTGQVLAPLLGVLPGIAAPTVRPTANGKAPGAPGHKAARAATPRKKTAATATARAAGTTATKASAAGAPTRKAPDPQGRGQESADQEGHGQEGHGQEGAGQAGQHRLLSGARTGPRGQAPRLRWWRASAPGRPWPRWRCPASTTIRFRTSPSTRPSSTQARWAASMRNMVEHGQTSGSSETTVLSGVSSSSRFTRWISVPTPMTEPLGASATARMMKSVEPTWSAASHHVVGALGVDHHDPAGVLGPEGVDVRRTEPLVDRAVALPQQQGGRLEGPVVEAAGRQAGVPHRHVVGAVAQVEAGVPAQVLVGEEQDLVPPAPSGLVLAQGPGEDGPGVGGRAHHAAVAADEGLEGGRRVHVGDRHHPVDVGDGGQRLPCLLDRVDVGHVGHGAPGVEVGQEHLLVVPGQDVGRLGHEVDPAEDDVLGLGLVGGDPGQPERVASGVGPGHDLVALVVVAEDEHPGAERLLGRPDPVGQLLGARRTCTRPGGRSVGGACGV